LNTLLLGSLSDNKEKEDDSDEPLVGFVDTTAHTCTGFRHDLICGKDSPSVSETPKALTIAIMDLNPKDFIFRKEAQQQQQQQNEG